MNRNALLLLAAAALTCANAPAFAGTFSGTGNPASNPAFSGGFSQLTFSGADQSFGAYTESGVTFGPGRISSSYADDYNSTGSYYDNDEAAVSQISFAFAGPVSAFAFNWGAGDAAWTVDLFAGASLLSSYQLTPTFGSNAKEYFGFTGAGITSVNISLDRSDWVFIDNLTYSSVAGAVPEPATWAMMVMGFGLVGAAARRRAAGKAGLA